jgi:N-dimethylarginine dimethylaminohydrolase
VQCTGHPAADECRYQVAWSINPHMAIGSVDFAQAAEEHASLISAMRASGAMLLQLPFVHGAYDSVFVKDPALLLSSRGRYRAILARFRHSERRQERNARAACFAREGYTVVSDDHGPHWEGGDVVMLPSCQGLFLGHGFRSEYAATAWLERHAGVPVWPLELTDPRLYHLDMVLAMLPDGTALVCTAALTPASLRRLEQVRGVRRVIAVSRETALRFVLNLVVINDTVVLGSHDHHIEVLVRSLGYRCVVVPLRQFQLAGGSAACLVAAVHHELFE